MILPRKHLSLNESYFGFGAFLLSKLNTPQDIEDLWGKYKEAYNTKSYLVKFSFDQFICTLDFLYLIGAVEQNEEGMICNEVDKSNS